MQQNEIIYDVCVLERERAVKYFNKTEHETLMGIILFNKLNRDCNPCQKHPPESHGNVSYAHPTKSKFQDIEQFGSNKMKLK